MYYSQFLRNLDSILSLGCPDISHHPRGLPLRYGHVFSLHLVNSVKGNPEGRDATEIMKSAVKLFRDEKPFAQYSKPLVLEVMNIRGFVSVHWVAFWNATVQQTLPVLPP
jgi:hypothetical protein